MRPNSRQASYAQTRPRYNVVAVWRLGFFFPFPCQPYQCHDSNCDRTAFQRRYPEDDSWVTAHNLYLTVYSASSINVLCFDPVRNCDQARTYAAKYCSTMRSPTVGCVPVGCEGLMRMCFRACKRCKPHSLRLRSASPKSSTAYWSDRTVNRKSGSLWNAPTMGCSTGSDAGPLAWRWCTTGSSNLGS